MAEEIINNTTLQSGGGENETPVTVLADNGYVFDGKYGPIPNADGTVDLSNWFNTYINFINFDGITINKEQELKNIKEYLDEVFTTGKYKVTNMNGMFFFTEIYNNPDEPTIPEILQYVDVSKWDTSNVTSMIGMFDKCRDITSLDVSNWDTSNVTDMSCVFSDCTSLTSLDLTNWDTSKVTEMVQMFSECDNLSTIIGTIDLTSCSNYPYSISEIFSHSNSLTSVNIKLPGTGIDSSKENDFVSNSGVSSKTSINFLYENWNLDRNFIASAEDSREDPNYYKFDGVYGPIPNENGEIDLSYYAIDYVEDYQNVIELPEENKAYLEYVLTTGKYKVNNMHDMFAKCDGLKFIDVSGWDTSNVTNMANMFKDCSSLTNIEGLSNFDTRNVNTIFYIFSNCKSLTNINVSNWNTDKITDMSAIFSNCSSITQLDLSNWNTSNVTNMLFMFSSCSKLESVIGTIDFASCNYYASMLENTTALTSINIKLNSNISSYDFYKNSYVTNTSAVHFVS